MITSPEVASALQRALDRRESRHAARAAVVALLTNEGAETAVVARPGVEPAFGPDALFLVYSITKSFTAAATLRLVASGELELDGVLARWLPWAPHAAGITLRQLLHHSSGLPDYGPLPEYHEAVRRGGEPWSEREFLRRTQAERLRFEPGEGWGYSNIGYMIVRRLLETVRGEGFGAVLRAEVFEPLGLERAFVPTDADLPRLTFGPSAYLGDEGPPLAVAAHYRLGWIAPGVVAATAAEVARFYHALLGGELFPPALLEAMRAVRLFDPIPGRPFVRPGYGLGIQVDAEAPCGPVWGHSGGGAGSSASACHRSHEQHPVTAVVLSDGEDGPQAEEMAAAGLAAACAGPG